MDTSRCETAPPAGRDTPDGGIIEFPSNGLRRERRMQVRAYNHWASLLEGRRFPSVADLSRGGMLDFCEHSLLLELSETAVEPAVAYIGDRLASECNAQQAALFSLTAAPANSLLERLAERYREVIASRSPSGFEAEIVAGDDNVRLYRGILLPFSRDDRVIDHVLAVINWKERRADARPQRTIAALAPPERVRPAVTGAQLTDWADGPGSELAEPCPPGADLPQDVAERLRALPLQPITALPPSGCEFALALVRRDGLGPAQLIGEVPHDPALIEEAAHRIAG